MQINSNSKKVISIIASCVIAAIMICISLFLFFPSIFVYGADIKTSKVYTTSDGVRYKGTEAGTEATLAGKAKGSFSLSNKVYMKKYDNNFFKIEFELQSTEFEMFVLTFLTKNIDDETKGDLVENKVEITSVDGKIQARAVNGLFKYEDQQAVAFAEFDKEFENAKVSLVYDSDLEAFKMTVDSTEKLLNSGSNVIRFYKDESNIKFTFDEIEDNGEAKVTVNNIAGQSMSDADSTGIVDTVKPIIIKETDKYNIKTGTSQYLVGANTTVDIPVRIYDVLQSQNESDLSIVYGSEEPKKEEDTVVFFAEKTGAIDVTLKTPSGIDDSTIDTVFNFISENDTTKPDKPVLSTVVEKYAAAGSEYTLKKPNITEGGDNLFDTKENVSFTLWYKTPTSTEWTKSTGLNFTPSIEGLYMVRVQATDRSKNVSEPSDAVEIEFRDQDAPKITISNFPKKVYKNDDVLLPSASVTDTVDSSPTTEIKLYMINDDGTKTEIELENNSFIAEKAGKYEAVYTAKDKANFTVTDVRTFTVETDTRPIVSPIVEFFTPLTTALVCIAAISLVGIVLLIFVKPKKKRI